MSSRRLLRVEDYCEMSLHALEGTVIKRPRQALAVLIRACNHTNVPANAKLPAMTTIVSRTQRAGLFLNHPLEIHLSVPLECWQ
jgi:hypothetical protein